ncbi:hypothetical protein PC110_g3960 [Phytophthora cactorum]|uniref:Uncharacterized protein n=1 Tax=Phytophthora cactorum TaxID=29920 RepID=A0A329STA5_9STRA|nr:hypothetical protein PC120_g19843 [Phytophthora cactorum]RAW39859.1 hypothetical protein PC110_g3960 [Phytophthora cactorum]
MLFVGALEPSSYVFPLVPHAATSDLPGEQTYSQEETIRYWERLEEKDNEVEEPPANPAASELIPGLTIHFLSRRSAAYATASPQIAAQWISMRGAWLLDSLTKAFAYVGTTTREEQSAGKC